MTAPFSMNAYIMYGWTLREEFNKEVNHVAQKLGVQTYHVILIIVIILIAIGRQQLRSPIMLLGTGHFSKWNSHLLTSNGKKYHLTEAFWDC